jgi:hypothetical protein
MINKHIQSSIALKVLGILLLSFQSLCAQQENSILGTWKFSDSESFARISMEVQAQLDTIPSLKSEIFASYMGREMSFMEDGSFRQKMPNGAVIPGKWALRDKLLILIDPEGNEYPQEIEELTDSWLRLRVPSSEDAKAVLTEIIYTKN